tara:strand:- start:841 stop:1830 length:990 start_codon:yes stop_codon:yes gene_type:complete
MTYKTQKRKNKEKRKNKTKKYKGNTYPYKNITKSEGVYDFLNLKNQTSLNPRSTIGNNIVNYGTEKIRVHTKYRGKSLMERWKHAPTRNKLKKFAKNLYKGKYSAGNLLHAYQSAIALQWATLSTMRPASALHYYRKYKATTVLDFTAGWGARMVGALAGNINYIGIDSNKSLKPGYQKILKALKNKHNSKVTLYFKKAENVDFSKLPKYDMVFTSPPYEYLELYQHMKNYENTNKIRQPASANKLKDKKNKSDGFYKDFLIPTIKEAYKYLPKNKWLCLNVPDLMYSKIKNLWKPCTKKENYMIIKRAGSNWDIKNRRGQEYIYCWKK